MLRISKAVLIVLTLASAVCSALANVDTLVKAPEAITFEKLFCAANQTKNPEQMLEITHVCWLRSTQSFLDLDLVEAMNIRFSNGDEATYHLSEFIFDTQLSRQSGSQILKSTLRGQNSNLGFALSMVYKEYAASSRLTREDRPLRMFGTFPSGHKFLIQRDLL